MDIGFLDQAGVFLGKGEEVVSRDSFLGHDLGRDGVVLGGVPDNPALGAFRYGSGVAPDQFCPGHLEALCQLRKVLLVFSWGDLLLAFRVVGGGKVATVFAHVLQVVEPPVEVDDIPLLPLAARLEPIFYAGQSFGCWATIGTGAVDVGLTFEEVSQMDGVADGNGIADEQDSGQAFHIGHLGHGPMGWALLLGFCILGICGCAEKSEEREEKWDGCIHA